MNRVPVQIPLLFPSIVGVGFFICVPTIVTGFWIDRTTFFPFIAVGFGFPTKNGSKFSFPFHSPLPPLAFA